MKCNKCIKPDMAQIPYIEHEYRMYKAYQREKRLKISLICSNIVWVLLVLILIAR